jgi:hypothetical protein
LDNARLAGALSIRLAGPDCKPDQDRPPGDGAAKRVGDWQRQALIQSSRNALAEFALFCGVAEQF